MTFFGQFFDHGLDLVSKGGSGTVYIPLSPDDPLYNPATPNTNFMVLTRATTVDGPDGPTQRNVTTSWVDQNQTYTSHASHQVFLREYERDPDTGEIVATGRLLDGMHEGAKNGLPTWADLKNQAREMLGIELTDRDVGSVPLLRTDAYGNFIPDPVTGYAQLIVGVGADGVPNTADDITVSGTPDAPVDTFAVGALRTHNAFLDDIAHNAVPVVTGGVLMPDDDDAVGYSGGVGPQGRNTHYDDELLDRHFITGDGRGNENIGLTTVHHVFHSEHNRQIELQKKTILESGNVDFINEWLREPITSLADIDSAAEIAALAWNGERLFQAGRMATEMQYQHLVFEEFGRKIQPAIDPFVFNSVTDINPSIFAEFANVVYRFGHSMLTDSMPRIHLNEDGSVASTDDMGLIASFLNPVAFDNDGTLTAEQAAGAIIRGMTTERGNEIDEFLTGALRNNLLGIPLDLAAINIARGRDTNMPTLNEAREQLYAATSSSFLKPYESWAEFASNLKNPMSVVNFIAAYGTHDSITGTIAQKREAAMLLVFGGEGAPADRLAFLNGTGTWSAANSGLNDIDLWIGGLAEKKMPFGGFLGSTFNAVFKAQMEALQDGDRFYYLTRTQGQNFLNELEQNSFAKMIMANTDIAHPGADGIRGTEDDIVSRHIGVDSFATYDYVFEVNAANQQDYDPTNASASGVDPTGNDPVLEGLGRGKVIRDNPQTDGPDAHYFRTFGGEHVVVGGTNQADTIITDFGDDGIWGDSGNDRIESGAGVDLVNGGGGRDIITDSGDSGDFLKGDGGDDVIANSNGLDVLMGGTGKDAIFVGVDDTEVFGGEGNDFILGGDGVDNLMGNEGNDWIEAGGGFDTTSGDNSELFLNSKILGHDVMFAGSEEHDFDAESGDDIMVQGESVMRNEGMFGYDWVTYKGSNLAADADMTVRIFTTDEQDVLRNRFDQVEGLSGWNQNDVLRGDSRTNAPGADPDDTPGADAVETRLVNNELSHAGVDRINGLRELLGDWLNPEGPAGSNREKTVAFEGGNIILGGGGSDLIEGRGGNDVIDGDHWLNVRIRITEPDAANTAANPIATINSLKHRFGDDHPNPAWAGKTVFQLMIDRVIEPSQLHIVRELVKDDGVGDTDVALFSGNMADYTVSGPDATGAVTVTDNVGTDGTDMLRNIERLRFADQTVQLVGGNALATGTITISDATPTEDQLLTATVVDLDDLNGIAPGTLQLRWQALNGTTWENIPGAIGPTFRPGDAVGGQQLRVVATFEDGNGVLERVASGPTAAVAAIDGAPTGLVGSLAVNENAPNTTLMGTLVGQDPDSTALTYSLVDDAGGRFTIDAAGRVKVADRYLIDFEQASSHVIRVAVSDGTSTFEQNITVTVNNVAPESVSGDGRANTILSGSGNDVLDGLGGTDTLGAGLGDDRYFVDRAADTVIENPGGGTGTVHASSNYALRAGQEIEILRANAGGTGLTLTGNELANRLFGGDGIDTLRGLAGNDTLYVDTAGDRVLEAAGQGNDRVVANVSYTLAAGQSIEAMLAFDSAGTAAIDLTGNALGQAIRGNAGANILNGKGGNDTLTGLGGADRFVFQSGFGADRIKDFDAAPAGGQDLIDLAGLGITAASFGAQVAISQAGAHARVTVGGNSITLLNTDDAAITQDDFLLA